MVIRIEAAAGELELELLMLALSLQSSADCAMWSAGVERAATGRFLDGRLDPPRLGLGGEGGEEWDWEVWARVASSSEFSELMIGVVPLLISSSLSLD